MVVFESSYYDFSLSIPRAKAEIIEADTQGVEAIIGRALRRSVTGRPRSGMGQRAPQEPPSEGPAKLVPYSEEDAWPDGNGNTAEIYHRGACTPLQVRPRNVDEGFRKAGSPAGGFRSRIYGFTSSNFIPAYLPSDRVSRRFSERRTPVKDTAALCSRASLIGPASAGICVGTILGGRRRNNNRKRG